MTLPEVQAAQGFLTWVHSTGRHFGHGNIEARWAEWKASPKTVVKKSNGYDRCSVRVKFPSGGIVNFNWSRSGEGMTLGGSSSALVAKEQQKTVFSLMKAVTPDETIAQKMERIAAFVADCTSVANLCEKINKPQQPDLAALGTVVTPDPSCIPQ